MKKCLGQWTAEKSAKAPVGILSGKTMAQLHLEVVAGLGNRIRALVSGICAAEDLGIPLVVHWNPNDRACACRFEAIFHPDSLPPSSRLNHQSIPSAIECLSVEHYDSIRKGWDGIRSLYMKSYGKFYGGSEEKEAKWLTTLRRLRPSAHVESEVSARLSHVNLQDALGVHIRGTDNLKSREASPFWAFDRYLMTETAKYFIVASDEDLLKLRLQQHFMDKCIFLARITSRFTEQGMVEAAIDFFALARCPRILGSAWSSFSHMAALYGGAELILAKAD